MQGADGQDQGGGALGRRFLQVHSEAAALAWHCELCMLFKLFKLFMPLAAKSYIVPIIHVLLFEYRTRNTFIQCLAIWHHNNHMCHSILWMYVKTTLFNNQVQMAERYHFYDILWQVKVWGVSSVYRVLQHQNSNAAV